MEQEEVLRARELRWHTRQALSRENGALISISFRAPHRLRMRPDVQALFERLCGRFLRQLAQESVHARELLRAVDADSPALHLQVEDALKAKAAAIRFEQLSPGGALLDIDVMDREGNPLSRRSLGQMARACLVCGEAPAALCISGQRHSREQSEAAFEHLLRELQDSLTAYGEPALRAMLYEAAVSPKPGLVDRFGKGAHADMDYFSFLRSAAALAGYFQDCGLLGEKWADDPGGMLSQLRPMGLAAERAMLRATGGANTHKGLIFSLGILCAAAGHMGLPAKPDALCATAARIASPALRDPEDGSHGFVVKARYGAPGIRGEAAGGFPSALAALPALEGALLAGESTDEAGLRCLLHLMAGTGDSNVLHRSGPEGLAFMHEGARALLTGTCSRDSILAFGQALEMRGISPGGCADLLAVCFFLHFAGQALLEAGGPG